MAYRNIGPAVPVDPVHVFAELGSVAVSVSVVLSHKQERVNHFVEEGLWKQVKSVSALKLQSHGL